MATDNHQLKKPKVEVIPVAIDDDLWVAQTDLDQLLMVLQDPVGWVAENVDIDGEPAVLWQPFAITFQEMDSAGGDQPIQVQGIDGTAVLTVQFAAGLQGKLPESILPSNTTVEILQVGSNIYTHTQLVGFNTAQVANMIFVAATDPDAYLKEMNTLSQTLNGEPVPLGQQMVFIPNPQYPIQFMYEGWTPQSEEEYISSLESDDPLTCDITTGTSDGSNNVVVNQIIVKAYTPSP